MGGILQHHPKILEEKAVAQGRLHAHVGGDAGEHQMTNAPAAQQAVERGIEKAAVARFRQHDIAGLRYQLIHQLIIPAAFRQQRALEFGPLTHGFQGVGFVKVG